MKKINKVETDVIENPSQLTLDNYIAEEKSENQTHKKHKNKIFNLSSISIIVCECLQTIISLFIDLFVVAQILQGEGLEIGTKIVYIGLYYAVQYAVQTLMYTVTGFGLKKINKSIFVSIGSICLTAGVMLVYWFSTMGATKLAQLMPIVGVVFAIAWGFFSGGFHNLTTETISSKHQVRFFAVKKICYQTTHVIFPVTLGLIIDNAPFFVMAIIMFVICALLITFSFFIKPKKSYKQSFDLPKFANYLKTHKEETKPLRLSYLQNFFRGASYDCFVTLITILVIKTFNSNTFLGTFQSIFTACSLLTLVFYLKFYRKKRAKWFLLTPVLLVSGVVCAMLIQTNKYTVVSFYGVYVVLNVILMSISDSRRASVVRTLSLHSHILENQAFLEFWLGAGRIMSTVVLILAGVFDGMMGGNSSLFLKIAIGFVCCMYIMYGVTLTRLENELMKQDKAYLEAHKDEVIEKNED